MRLHPICLAERMGRTKRSRNEKWARLNGIANCMQHRWIPKLRLLALNRSDARATRSARHSAGPHPLPTEQGHRLARRGIALRRQA